MKEYERRGKGREEYPHTRRKQPKKKKKCADKDKKELKILPDFFLIWYFRCVNLMDYFLNSTTLLVLNLFVKRIFSKENCKSFFLLFCFGSRKRFLQHQSGK